MGHANLTNLSDLFVNLLYAKGRLTIERAIHTAVHRMETLHASEGEHEDEEMLGLGFMDVVAYLSSRDGRDYSGPRPWTGPYIAPDWEVCKPPKGTVIGENAKLLLQRCRKISLGYIPVCPVWFERDVFAICADAIQDDGHEEWAELIRSFPHCYRAWSMWDMDDDAFHDGDEWEWFDKIRWVFSPGWRKRYRDVPRLSFVTH